VPASVENSQRLAVPLASRRSGSSDARAVRVTGMGTSGRA
jgi:hypothetical protein